MKSWTSATGDGVCSYAREHTWKAGARIFRVQGSGWQKDYCGPCAVRRQEAPPDTGQILDVTDAPNYPAPLREIAETASTTFLGATKVLPFDGRMAAAGRDD